MKSRFYKLAVIILILILAVGSCRKAGTWLVKTDKPEHADVLFMLMGSISDRVLQIADLYQEKKAGEVWIVLPGVEDESDIIWLRQPDGNRHTWDADDITETFELVDR